MSPCVSRLQHYGGCFYCDACVREPAPGQVDHFIPWSRYPDDGLDSLVVADERCNGFKSSSLAAAEHVARWSGRFAEDSTAHAQLAVLAEQSAWDRHPARSLSVARAIYLRLPDDARLWQAGQEFVAPDKTVIGSALMAGLAGLPHRAATSATSRRSR